MHINSARTIDGEIVKKETPLFKDLERCGIPYALKLYLDNRLEALRLHEAIFEKEEM